MGSNPTPSSNEKSIMYTDFLTDEEIEDAITEVNRRLMEGVEKGISVWPNVTVGPGWYRIVAETHLALDRVIPGYYPAQVKEKFGGLRYYVDMPANASDVEKMIVFAITTSKEEESFRYCEECGRGSWDFSEGTEGHIATNSGNTGWVRTLCDRCRITFEELRQERVRVDYGAVKETLTEEETK